MGSAPYLIIKHTRELLAAAGRPRTIARGEGADRNGQAPHYGLLPTSDETEALERGNRRRVERQQAAAAVLQPKEGAREQER